MSIHQHLQRCLACLLIAVLLLPGAASAAQPDYEDHLYLADRGQGNCASLTGHVRMAVVFVELPDAPWHGDDVSGMKASITSAASTLMTEAAGYGANLAIELQYHNADATVTPRLGGSNRDWVNDILRKVSGVPAQDDRSAWTNMPALFLLNVTGRAFAQGEYSLSKAEYAILYRNSDAGVIRHELLHLFGASDYYLHSDVKAAARTCFPDSIMLSSAPEKRTEGLTAYIVGWTDELDRASRTFLELTSDVTSEDLSEARDANRITGFGTVETDSGVYTGMLTHGSYNGRGMFEWNNGTSYMGDWDWGEQTGRGTIVWASGNRYTGDFVNGVRTGKGSFTWANGDNYTGDFVENQLTGKGAYTWANGNQYSGDFVDGVRTGKGVFLWASGASYTGDFVENQLTGRGVYAWPDGSTYSGDFVDGVRTGQGVHIWADGTVYTGSFLGGRMHGQGATVWENGSAYTGGYVNDQREGYGVYHSADGVVMDGQWHANEFIGD